MQAMYFSLTLVFFRDGKNARVIIAPVPCCFGQT